MSYEKQKKEKKPRYYRLEPQYARFHSVEVRRHADGKFFIGRPQGKGRPWEFEEVYLSRDARDAIQCAMLANQAEVMIAIIADAWEALGIVLHLGLNERPKSIEYVPHEGCFSLTVPVTTVGPETGEMVEWVLELLVSSVLPQRIETFDYRSLVNA
ncbi:MAG: hypothetical protein WAW80_02910 [Candidatus Saccharimonadales bacterium]